MFTISNITWLLLLVGTCALLLGQAAFFKEGFMFGQPPAGQPGVRCGVDLPECSSGLACMNGFCRAPQAPPLLDNELPVYP